LRKSAFLFVLLAVCFSFLLAQQRIENPAKPQNPNAGRTLKLEEVLKITDESGDFFFQSPRDIKVAPDGSLFISDRESLVRLDEDGNFINDYYKKGQGPGELNSLRAFVIEDDVIIIYSGNPNKLVWFKFSGELIQDKKIFDVPGFLRLVHHSNGLFYFIKYGIPNTEGKFDIVDIPQNLIAVDNEGQLRGEIASFPTKVFASGSGTSGAMVNIEDVYSVPMESRILLVSHTSEYLVKVFDLDAQSVVRSFTRKYKRIRPPADWQSGRIGTGDGKMHSPPRPDFLNDISGFFPYQGKLWIMTSTKDDKKGQLIDVFDAQGTFVDSFYLKIDGRLMGTHEDCLFVLKRNEDDLVYIVKYRVID
jgi:hypothetical protein